VPGLNDVPDVDEHDGEAAPLGFVRLAPLSAAAVSLTAATVQAAALIPLSDLLCYLVSWR